MAIEYKCDFCDEKLAETERTTITVVLKFPEGSSVKTMSIPMNTDLHVACAGQAKDSLKVRW